MLICVDRGADLHMAQRIPLPLTVSCFSKIQIGFTFLVPADPGCPGQRAVKRVSVCVCYFVGFGFFQYRAKRLARKNVSEMAYFVSSGTYNLAPSIRLVKFLTFVDFGVLVLIIRCDGCLQCFDTVGWAAGRSSGL